MATETCCSQARSDQMCLMGAAAGRTAQNDGGVTDCSVAPWSNNTTLSCEDISVYRKCCMACQLGAMTRVRLSLASGSAALGSQCRAIASTTVSCTQTEPFLQCCQYEYDNQGQGQSIQPRERNIGEG